MSRLDRIAHDHAVMHGRPTVRWMRVRVADVLSMLADGMSEAEIIADFP